MKSRSAQNPFVIIASNEVRVSIELLAIEKIKKHRNNILTSLCDIMILKDYLFLHFRQSDISSQEMMAISKALSDFSKTQLDLIHYSILIRKLTHDLSLAFNGENEMYFHYEIEKFIRKRVVF